MDVYALNIGMHDGGGNFAENVLHYNVVPAGAPSAYDVAKSLIDAWQTSNLSLWLACFAADVVVDYISARRVSSGGGPTSTKAIGSNGSVSMDTTFSAAANANVALIVDSATNRFGHTYMPFLYTGAVIEDVIQLGYRGTLASLFTQLLVVLTSASITSAVFAVYNRQLGTAAPITSTEIRAKVTAMNRRLLPKV